MTGFNQAIEAQLAGATVRAAPLVMFDFRSGPMRLWPGFGEEVTQDGETWQGTAGVGTISPMSAGPGQAVEEMSFSLASGPGLLASFSADAAEATGREVNVYLQFFEIRREDEAGNWVEWQELDTPFQTFWGVMGPLKGERPETAVGEQATRAISVTASNAFIHRRRPSFGFYSDRDQKARTDGTDNMFINASRMASAQVRWPARFTS